jgi:hypothetical protein
VCSAEIRSTEIDADSDEDSVTSKITDFSSNEVLFQEFGSSRNDWMAAWYFFLVEEWWVLSKKVSLTCYQKGSRFSVRLFIDISSNMDNIAGMG